MKNVILPLCITVLAFLCPIYKVQASTFTIDSTAPTAKPLWITSLVGGTTPPAKSIVAPVVTSVAASTTNLATSVDAELPAGLDLQLLNNMVCVEGGTFVMGCIETTGDCWENESPAHSITLKGFYLAKFEVTQDLWYKVMGNNPSKFSACAECPAESVTWNEVQTFIARLNKNTGKHYRLPTEAEWEYAAREGGKNLLFANGTNIATSEGINFNAQGAIKKNYTVTGHARQATTPVGTLTPNGLGLHDMSGNVWEWCSDYYLPYCTSEASGTTPVSAYAATTPPPATTVVAQSQMRAIRGGSWKNAAQFCRTTARGKEDQQKANMFIGFRLAMDK